MPRNPRKSMTIQVGEEAIGVAQTQDKGHCAIAYSIALQYPNARTIKVTRDEVSYSDCRTRVRYRYEAPENVRQFIDKFDAGAAVHPIRISLDDDRLVSARPMKSRSPKQVADPKRPQYTGKGTALNQRRALMAQNAAAAAS